MKLKVKVENQTFDIEVGDLSAKPIKAEVDGEVFEVFLEESVSQVQTVVSAGALSTTAAAAPVAATPVAPAVGGSSSKSVVAPIPGTIVAISVKPGESVQHGQELCALEAMKMKNAIRSTRAGTIGAVHISVGDQVKHGQLLMEYAE